MANSLQPAVGQTPLLAYGYLMQDILSNRLPALWNQASDDPLSQRMLELTKTLLVDQNRAALKVLADVNNESAAEGKKKFEAMLINMGVSNWFGGVLSGVAAWTYAYEKLREIWKKDPIQLIDMKTNELKEATQERQRIIEPLGLHTEEMKKLIEIVTPLLRQEVSKESAQKISIGEALTFLQQALSSPPSEHEVQIRRALLVNMVKRMQQAALKVEENNAKIAQLRTKIEQASQRLEQLQVEESAMQNFENNQFDCLQRDAEALQLQQQHMEISHGNRLESTFASQRVPVAQ